MARFTPTQGRYLAFIHTYTRLHGCPPAESEIAAAMCVSPPSVNQMVKTLEKRGLILRHPGVARSLQIIIPEDKIPSWRGGSGKAKSPSTRVPTDHDKAALESLNVNLYVLKVFIVGGPISKKFANKEISRVIEIRGDQTLSQLHACIFQAFDRWDEHLYEFQFGKKPFDPKGPNYGIQDSGGTRKPDSLLNNAETTNLDSLNLKAERVFGYWFDFGDDWYHQAQVERIDKAIPTVTYPRVIRRVGKSPPQYLAD